MPDTPEMYNHKNKVLLAAAGSSVVKCSKHNTRRTGHAVSTNTETLPGKKKESAGIGGLPPVVRNVHAAPSFPPGGVIDTSAGGRFSGQPTNYNAPPGQTYKSLGRQLQIAKGVLAIACLTFAAVALYNENTLLAVITGFTGLIGLWNKAD